MVVDKSLEGRKNLVCGANKLDYHLRNVVPGRDFTWTLAADIRSVNEGEACPRRMELAAASWWSAKPSRSATSSSWATGTPTMGARVLDANGKEMTPIMGSYGIGIERILTAAIEQSNDANGFCLPASIAPFTVVVTVTNVGDAAAARDRREDGCGT